MSTNKFFNNDPHSSLRAISIAQKIAFAPIIFQSAIVSRDFHILTYLDTTKKGRILKEITKHSGLSDYSTSVLPGYGIKC